MLVFVVPINQSINRLSIEKSWQGPRGFEYGPDVHKKNPYSALRIPDAFCDQDVFLTTEQKHTTTTTTNIGVEKKKTNNHTNTAKKPIAKKAMKHAAGARTRWMPILWILVLSLCVIVGSNRGVEGAQVKRKTHRRGLKEPHHDLERPVLRDPNFHVGRWGQYGGIHYGPDWLHRDMKTQNRVSQDPRRGDPILEQEQEAEHPDAHKRRVRDQQENEREEERQKREADIRVPSDWHPLSPLTDSAVPPLVIRLPMTERERGEHERLLRSQKQVRLKHGGAQGVSSHQERDLQIEGHPLPASYQNRIRELASNHGFTYRGLAMPTISPDHHIFHMRGKALSELMEQIAQSNPEPSTDRDEEATTTTTETKRHPHLPPVPNVKHGSSEWLTSMEDQDDPDRDATPPDWLNMSPQEWHWHATQSTRQMAGIGDTTPPDRSTGGGAGERMRSEQDSSESTTTVETIREWQTRFEKTMRERNAMRKGIHDWQREWKAWARNAGPEFQRIRLKALDTLYRRFVATLSNDPGLYGDHEIWVQRPQPRALRVQTDRQRPRGMPRQPSIWVHYRERWDAPSNDPRPYRSFRNDRRHRAVADPMLTEEWNVYDANDWGDVPPGPRVIRPSLSAGPPVWDRIGYDGTGVNVGVVDSGFELGHPELHDRYARALSLDALDTSHHHQGGRPPTPIDPWTETHGTQAAGVVVAQRGNGVCGAGVSPGARLGAIRLLGQRSPTDAEEAAAISHACRAHGRHPSRNALINHIFTCSWGPLDDGADLRGPGPLATHAMEQCVYREGRQGKGSIYVWAGGNGRTTEDNANFDGYANRPETIAVGAIDDTGSQAWYSEPGACLMVTAPSSGGSSGIVTADPSGPAGLSTGQCTRNFGGTSAAAPSVAGVVALMLQAANDLGWRDVQHILVNCAQKIMYSDRREPWTQTEAGYWHSHGYGFGLLNATCAVELAMTWTPLVPRESTVYSSPIVDAADSWDQVARERMPFPHKHVHKDSEAESDYHDDDEYTQEEVEARTPVFDSGEDQESSVHGNDDDDNNNKDTEDDRAWKKAYDRARIQEGMLDTTGYHPVTGTPRHANPIGTKEALAGDPTPGTHGDKTIQEIRAERTESAVTSVALFGIRLAYHLGRKFYNSVEERAQIARELRKEARRALAPNQVRISEVNQRRVAIPPGFSAHFDWEWPLEDPTAGSHPSAAAAAPPPSVNRLEHVGLRLHADLPSGRGLLRIWLCAPSGTCSLMAQAPRKADRNQILDGNKWTFWTVRHWDESPYYLEDRTGHGPGTWSLRLSHTWPADPHKAHRMRDYRVRHPQQVDATIHWWQLEFRGRQDT